MKIVKEHINHFEKPESEEDFREKLLDKKIKEEKIHLI